MTTNKINNSKKSLKQIFSNSWFSDTIFTIIIFLIMILIVSSPERFTSGTISGLKLFFFSVLPGLFPFMLLTKLLTELGVFFKISSRLDKFSYKLFGTPGVSIYALLMSIISGYPIGAKIISELYEKGLISETDAKKMSVFCTTSGPIFVIGTVGTFMFGEFKFGIILYLSHIISSVMLGIILHIFSKKKDFSSQNTVVIDFKKKSNIIGESVSQTINSLFVVGAYITIFYLISEVFETLKIFDMIGSAFAYVSSALKFDPKYIKPVVYGILEVTRGAKELSVFANNTSLILASGILSFSGLSIIMQSMAFLKSTKIKAHKFIFAKCLHAILSMILCAILLLIFL